MSTGNKSDYRPAERKHARTMFLLFELVNTFSFTLLAGNIVILLLLRFGASSFLIGIVQAFPYVSYLFMPFAKQLVPRFGLVKTFGTAWTARYFMMLPLAFAPLVVLAGYTALGIALVLGGFFMFQIMRGFGLVSISPLTQAISKGKDRGAFLSNKNIVVYAANLLTGFIISMALGKTAALERYTLFMCAGIILGFVACVLIFRIPEPPQGRSAASRPFWADVKIAMQDSSLRRFLLAYGFFMFLAGFGRSFLIVYAKRGFGLSDDAAMLITVVGGIGAILMGYFSRMAIDRLGSKPLLIMFTMIFLSSLVPLIVVPAFGGTAAWIFLALVAFASTFGGAGGENAAQAYFYTVAKQEQQFNVGMLYYLILGGSGALGSFSGGWYLDVLASMNVLSTAGLWRVFYITVLAFGLVTLLLQFRIRKTGGASLVDALGTLLTPQGLLAMGAIERLDRSSSVHDEVKALKEIRKSGSHLATDVLVARLDSPVFAVRNHAIRALEKIPAGTKVEDALIRQIEEERFATSYRAARILGQHRRIRAIPALRKGLASSDYLLQAYCIAALADMGDADSRLPIEAILRTSENPLITIHALGALRSFGAVASLETVLDVFKKPYPAPFLRDEMVFSLAGLCGIDAWLYPRYTAFLLDANTGIALLHDDLFSMNEDLEANEAQQKLYDDLTDFVSKILLYSTDDCESKSRLLFDNICVQTKPSPAITEFMKLALPESGLYRYERFRFLLLAVLVNIFTGPALPKRKQVAAFTTPW